jgi:hypothetical protein
MGGSLVSTAWMRVLVALCVVLAWGGVVAAAPADQADPNAPSPTPQQPRRAPDFFFGEPRGSLGIRANWVFARAGSDLFDFVRQQLTINKGDFDSPAFALDVGIPISPRVDVLVGFDFSNVHTSSEYRDFVDNNRQPITQDTELREAGVSGSVRIALTPRGRSISRLAWIPRRATPYGGAGGGYLWYRFQQRGDFIDVFSPRRAIFSDTLTSQGWAPSAHVFGGVDVQLYRRLFGTVEGRYVWASARLDRSFEGFDPIDLAGARFGVGINVLF